MIQFIILLVVMLSLFLIGLKFYNDHKRQINNEFGELHRKIDLLHAHIQQEATYVKAKIEEIKNKL